MTIGNTHAYDEIPDLYDFEYPECAGPELDFWDLLANQSEGPLLELAVGTGRIGLPLARLGHEVWGIDTSEPMLARARKKVSKLPAPIRPSVHLINQSMSSFDLSTRFALIYAPFNSFLLLDPQNETSACLDCVHDHLKLEGKFVIDAFAPGPDDFLPDVETLTYLEHHPQTGARVTRERRYEYDPSNGAAISNVTYTLTGDGLTPRIVAFEYKLQLYKAEQLIKNIKGHGFEVLETFGDYRGRAYEGPEDNLILICRSAR